MIGLVAFASSGAGWWFLSGRRFEAGARLFVLSEAMLLVGTAIAFDQLSRWHEAAPKTTSLVVLPLLLLALAVCAAPLALVGVGALRTVLAERRAADATTIDGYLARLSVCLRTTPSLRKRILREAEDHLRIASAEVGEAKAIERFGSPEQLAEAFAEETRGASAYAVAWTTLAAVATGLAALLAGVGYTLTRTVSDALGRMAASPDTFWDWRVAWPRLERESSALSLVAPPFRGGLSAALAVSVLLALSLALAAVATVRRRPRLAVGFALAAIGEGALGFGLTVVLERRLAHLQIAVLPPHVKWAAIAIGVVLVVTLWWAIELEFRSISHRSAPAALFVLVALPLLAGAFWRAPQPPSDGYLGAPPSRFLGSGPGTLGRTIPDSPVAIAGGSGKIAFAWVGLAGLDSGRPSRKVGICGYVFSIEGRASRPVPISVSVSDPGAIDALAVRPTAQGTSVAWGTASGLWLQSEAGRAKQIAAGRVGAVQLLSVRGRLTLLANVDGRLVLAQAPIWRVMPLANASGALLSAQTTGSGFAVLTRNASGLRFDLRAATGLGRRSWSIPVRNAGGAVGLLANGSPAIAFAGMDGGRSSLWLGTVGGGRLVRRLIASDLPCAVPIALGSVNGSTAVLTSNRCSAIRHGTLFTPDLVRASELISRDGNWRQYQFPDLAFDRGVYFDGAPYGVRVEVADSSHSRLPFLTAVGDDRLVWP